MPHHSTYSDTMYRMIDTMPFRTITFYFIRAILPFPYETVPCHERWNRTRSCGGTDLWAKTQAQYFAREMERRPFLKMVNAIIKSELGGLVETSDLNQWQETLAILSTYAKHPEFPKLCEALAARLENEAGDRKSAILCYM